MRTGISIKNKKEASPKKILAVVFSYCSGYHSNENITLYLPISYFLRDGVWNWRKRLKWGQELKTDLRSTVHVQEASIADICEPEHGAHLYRGVTIPVSRRGPRSRRRGGGGGCRLDTLEVRDPFH